MDKDDLSKSKTRKQKHDKIKNEILKIYNGKVNKETDKKHIIIRTLIEYLGITIGTLLMAVGTMLLVSNELSTGGFSGIATIFYYLSKLPIGITMLLLNIPLLITSYIKLGRDFLFKSIYGIVTFSLFVDMLDVCPSLTTDKFLACIYGGIVVGIGNAIVLKLKGSTGGSDLFSYIVRVYRPQYRTSKLILIFDFVVVMLNVIFFQKIEVGLYSAIAIYLMGKMIDIIFEGTDFAKTLFIISPKYKEIAKAVGESINRGSTGIYSRGMYTNEEKMTLLCVGSRTEAYNIQSIARKIDKNAFIIILNAKEVLGRGFK